MNDEEREYKSLREWREAIVTGKPITPMAVKHNWQVCAVGCKIKQLLGYNPKHWSDTLIERSLCGDAHQLGRDFTSACRMDDRPWALQTLTKIEALETIFCP